MINQKKLKKIKNHQQTGHVINAHGILLDKQIDILQGRSIKVSKDFNFWQFLIQLKILKNEWKQASSDPKRWPS
jgi:hypothetical protein